MKFPHYNRNWNEFDWEKELRKDEARINTYMRELPRFIDLPDEEDMIMKKLQKNPELVPQNIDLESISFSEFFDDFISDEESFSTEDWRKRKGASVYLALEKLAHQWCIIFATEINQEHQPLGLKIICLYGKLMARCGDIIDLDSEDCLSLKITLGKRICSNINKLIGELREFSEEIPELHIKIESQIMHLQSTREKVLMMLEEFRKS
jgi:hypothetical protein